MTTPPLAPCFTWKKLLLWSDVAIFLLLAGTAVTCGPATWWKALGLTLAAPGFLLWMVARHQLGRSFTATAQARQLVSTGLYLRFRHPIYYFGSLAHLGVMLALQVWWITLIWLACSSVIQWKRLTKEDRILEEAFGKDFKVLRDNAWV